MAGELEFYESWLNMTDLGEIEFPTAKVNPLKLIPLLDLTTLQGDDDQLRVHRLAERACGSASIPPCAAVCVFPVFIEEAKRTIAAQKLPGLPKVATVAGGFPHGLSPLEARVREVELCQVADEVDVVIRRDMALAGNWKSLFDEIVQMRLAASGKTLKVILATGELSKPDLIYKASLCALMAGADFIKTSTGKEATNATIEAGWVMTAALNRYGEKSGRSAGIKAAGGIRTLAEATEWWNLVYQRLGADACAPARFRIGASSLLDDLIRNLG